MKKLVAVLPLLVVIAALAGIVHATPPSLPEMTAEQKQVLAEIERLEANKDLTGLLGLRKTFEEKKKIGGMENIRWAQLRSRLMEAFAAQDVDRLRQADLIAFVREDAGRGGFYAMRLLAKIGTDEAVDLIIDVARMNPELGREIIETRGSAFFILIDVHKPRATAAVLGVVLDRKEHQDIRSRALRSLERATLSEDEYRQLYALSDDRNDPLARTVLGHAGANAIGPLIEVITRMSRRMMTNDREEETHAVRAFEDALRSLEFAARTVEKRVGCTFVLAREVRVLRGNVEVISYDRAYILRNDKERERVVDFWTTWWRENREAVLHPEAPRPEDPWMREKDPARRTYLHANALWDKRQLDEAAALYRQVIDQYPGTSPAHQSAVFLSRIHAVQGKPEEAFKTLLAARLADLQATGTPPRTKDELEILHAQVRVQVARACADDAHTVEGLRLARAQYEKLIEESPNSPLVSGARNQVQELDRRIPLELARQKEREVLLSLVKQIEKAINEKDVEAYLALHAPSPDLGKKREEFEQAIKDPEFLVKLPMAYEVDRIQFSDDLKYALVDAGVRIAGAKERAEGLGKTFQFVKTPEGWRLGPPRSAYGMR